MKIDHKEIIDNTFYSVSARMAVLIEDALHRGREILHTSITADSHRFYGTIIWKEKEEQEEQPEISEEERKLLSGECCLRDHANATAPWTCQCKCHNIKRGET